LMMAMMNFILIPFPLADGTGKASKATSPPAVHEKTRRKKPERKAPA